MDFIVIIVLMFVVLYFLMIRPQKKKAAAQQAEMATLEPGDRVMLHSGIFATISHMGDKQVVVELAPGIEVTVMLQAIARRASKDEEEFEFTDEDGSETLSEDQTLADSKEQNTDSDLAFDESNEQQKYLREDSDSQDLSENDPKPVGDFEIDDIENNK